MIGHVFSTANARVKLWQVDILNPLLNEQDKRGCTPLHYAAQTGLLQANEDVMLWGASTRTKNIDSQSPLHIAAA